MVGASGHRSSARAGSSRRRRSAGHRAGLRHVHRRVGDHEHGDARGYRLGSHSHHRLAADDAKIASRFVGKDHARFRDKCACRGDRLLLAAGQLLGSIGGREGPCRPAPTPPLRVSPVLRSALLACSLSAWHVRAPYLVDELRHEVQFPVRVPRAFLYVAFAAWIMVFVETLCVLSRIRSAESEA